ncbi:MAG: transposase [bacterium]|nr:transposase [bacterium]
MNKSKFSEDQIKELLSNPNVTKCSDKAISYDKNFKVRAVRRYNENGQTVNQIFREAGFDLGVIGKDTPKNCLRDWRRIFRLKGADGLKIENRGGALGRGGRPITKGLTDADRIKRMEAEIAYLKAENDFLAKLRAKRAE